MNNSKSAIEYFEDIVYNTKNIACNVKNIMYDIIGLGSLL